MDLYALVYGASSSNHMQSRELMHKILRSLSNAE